MTLKDYKKLISMATTKEELTQISYQALQQDDRPFLHNKTLYNKVVTLCVYREIELGF